MEIHQLRYFLEVARRLNFSRAAAHCHVAQPSLSQQIKKLEQELGEPLFERTPTGARLTEAGRLFLPHAERVLAEVSEAGDVLRGRETAVRGTVRLGAIPTLSPYVVPSSLHACARRHGELSIVGHEDLTASLLQGVENRDLDLALISLPAGSTKVEAEILAEEELWVALPTRHRLAKLRRVPPSALASEPFFLMKEGHCLAGQVLAVCEARSVVPQVSFRSVQIETLRLLIAEGQGISLIPAMACRRFPGVVYRRLSGDAPKRRIGLIWLRGKRLSLGERAVADALGETIRRALNSIRP